MSSSNSPRAKMREGIALPIALAAIVAVGALVAGVVFASTQEYRVGRNTMAAQVALHGAEVGLNSVISSWTPARTQKLKVGFRDTLADTTIDGAYVKREWTRVSPTMFYVTSTAIAGSTSLQARALKRLNSLVRVDIPDMRIQGAITARGNISVGGSATIIGNDVTPAGWDDCVGAGAPSSGIVVGAAANATGGGGCAAFACVSGSPKVTDSTIYADSNTYKKFGGFDYDSLTKLASADKIFTAGGSIDNRWPLYNADGSCNTASPINWGDTSRVNGPPGCKGYTPVVWLKDRTKSWTLTGKGGQGILLVDGNVTFNGKFVWYGLVIVQGKVAGEGMNSPKIVGGLMAMNRDNLTNTIAGDITIQFSRCTLQAVTARLATARQTKYRAWADMSF